MADHFDLDQPLPEWDAAALTLDFNPPPVYRAPRGDQVLLAMGGAYTAPAGNAVLLGMTNYPPPEEDEPYQPPAGASVDLVFAGEYEPPAGDGVTLNFAHAGWQPPDVVRVEVVITSTLRAPTHEATAEAVTPITVTSTLSAPQHRATLSRDINVYRDPSRLTASGWEQAERQAASTASAYGNAPRRRAQAASRYQQAAPLSRTNRAPARMLPRADVRRRVVQEQAAPLRRGLAWRNEHLPRLDRFRRLREEQGERLDLAAAVRNAYMPHRRTHWGLPFEQASRILGRHWGMGWEEGAPLHLGTTSPYEQAKWPPPGISVPPGPPEPPEPGEPWQWDGILNFCGKLPRGTDLDFAADPCDPDEPAPPIDVPIQRTYLVSNSASLTLVATGQAIDVAALSVAIDADSWSWELRATVVGEPAIALVRDAAQPAEVEAVINGRTWRCVIDDWRRDRAWGQMPAATISARSLAAYLGAPHAAARSYTETETRTAQQLAEQELPLGWTLDWEIDDWLVPPEAWHYTERTPIEAITAIAAAAGAVVQAHPSEPRLTVAPRYATPHWAWGTETPDVTLPLDILTRLGTEYRPVEALNAVYVSGETAGVLALVRRTGTAGDRLAPMIVDPLNTEPAPARGRGLATLSATGEQTRETLVLPLSDSLAGLLGTGQLLRIDPDGSDWRGLVRGVSINARLEGIGASAALVVDQTVDVERHLEETA